MQLLFLLVVNLFIYLFIIINPLLTPVGHQPREDAIWGN